jgi:ankyrin repeat protein
MLIVPSLSCHAYRAIQGAAIDITNSEGESALFFAARKQHPAVVRLLLQRGANAVSGGVAVE